MKTSNSQAKFWQQFLLWGTGGVGLLGLLFVVGIWQIGDRTLNFVGSLFRLQVESKVEPVEPIVQRLKNIQELSTTVLTTETIVPASAERKIGEIPLATTKLLYIARGEIRAGIDLSELEATDVVVKGDRLEINLPPAKILDSKIDVNRSRVYDYDRGFLNLGPDVAPQLQTLAQQKTLTKIINTACNEGILKRANSQAKTTIAQIFAQSNYQVKVNLTKPESCNAPAE